MNILKNRILVVSCIISVLLLFICFYCFYVACSAGCVYYCVVLYVSDVRLSHLNKDYLLTYLLTCPFSQYPDVVPDC